MPFVPGRFKNWFRSGRSTPTTAPKQSSSSQPSSEAASSSSTEPWTSGSDSWLERKAEKLDVALSALEGLDHASIANQTRRTNRMFDAVNTEIYKERAKKFGVGTMPAEEDETQNVSIESPVTHNYFQQSGVPGWVKAGLAAAAIATGGGLGWLALDRLTPRKPSSQTLDPGSLGIEVIDRGVKDGL